MMERGKQRCSVIRGGTSASVAHHEINRVLDFFSSFRPSIDRATRT
jgi:hypothetical protein